MGDNFPSLIIITDRGHGYCVRILLHKISGGLKVHKRENFLGSNIEICTFS